MIFSCPYTKYTDNPAATNSPRSTKIVIAVHLQVHADRGEFDGVVGGRGDGRVREVLESLWFMER